MSMIPGLPGLGAATSESDPSQQPAEQARDILLPAGTEWRFEVPFDKILTLTLQPTTTQPDGANNHVGGDAAGTAEIFGTELAPNKPYEFSGAKAAVYTHHGCTLSITGGPCESEYVAEETPTSEHLNLHFALEALRDRAAASIHSEATGGPRVLVIGPHNSGKTSLVKTLASWAARCDRSPMVVNLDPRMGMLSLPGCLSATVLGSGSILDVEDTAGGGWGSSPIAGPSAVPIKMPLAYQFGYSSPEERPEVFKPVATRLALAATSRFEDDEEVKKAGIIVDLAGGVCTNKGGYDIISHVVSEFSINVLLILGSERLYSDMQKRFPSPSTHQQQTTQAPTPQPHQDEPIHILKLSKSGGCVDLDPSYLKTQRQLLAKQYFFGTRRTTLSPHTLTLDFEILTLYSLRDTERDAEDAAFLPGGQDDENDEVDLAIAPFTKTKFNAGLQGQIIALKHANATDSQAEVRSASVLGYLYVDNVDEARKKMRVLSPVGGRLPGRVGVVGVWPEGWGDVVGG